MDISGTSSRGDFSSEIFFGNNFAKLMFSIIFVYPVIERIMKYAELHRKLRKAGCYPTGYEIAGHPEWYSPITDKYFPTSHHDNREVATGTLKSIFRDAGIK